MKKIVRTFTWGLSALLAAGALSSGLFACGSSSSGSGGGSTSSSGSAGGSGVSCTDAVKNGAETDVDCGGGTCPTCALSKGCGGDGDCAEGACIGGVCTIPPAGCMDGMKSGTETDVDCGGVSCPTCADGKACGGSGDCQSKSCVSGACAQPVVGLAWAKSFGNDFDQSCFVVRTDPSDNVVLSNWIQGMVDFGKGKVGLSEQIALVELGPDGATQWAKSYPTGSKQYPYALGVNASGNPFLGGGFYNTLKFGAPAPDLTPVGADDFFAAGFSPAGATLWAKSFGNASQFQQFNGMAIDAQGNPVMTGWLQGSANFGGGTLNSAGQVDIVVAKLDKATGGHIWSHAYGDGNLQGGFSVAIDGNGEVIVSGYLNGSVDFGGGPIGGGNALFLLKLTAGGQFVWARAFPSTASELRPNRVAVDAAGNIFLAGGSIGTLDFGGGALAHMNGVGVYDAFLAKFDSKGNHQWSKTFGDSDEQWVDAVAVDPAGNVLILGSFLGTMNLGGGNLVSMGGNEFGGDVFIAKFSTTGTWLYNQRFGDGSHQMSQSLTVDSTGAAILCGEFKGSIDFGGGPLNSAGGTDIFVAKMTLP
ncbi:MAG: hypothetical protein ABI193_06420 [Minicystis sp.]